MQAKTAMSEVGRLLQKAGPYVALEVVLPGGTLFALLLYLHRTGQLRKVRAMGAALARSVAFALQPPGSLRTAKRGDAFELQLLAASR
ncbi:MAG: hypothetical protein U1F54_08005 [Burkholderiales bacterium]